MNASILTIGDEILIGQVVDTNSAYISRGLNALGIKVEHMLSVSDTEQGIVAGLNYLYTTSQLVIITGGLGPTKDDITKQVLGQYFGMPRMYSHEPTLRHIEELLGRRGIAMIESNVRQADVPDGCTVLPNALGSAPGMWFEHQGKLAVSLPGVPFEMENLIDQHVLPRLRQLVGGSAIVHQTVLTYGVPESILAQTIAPWEDALPPHLHLAYLPSPSGVKLRLSTYEAASAEQGQAQINDQVQALQAILGNHIIAHQDITMEQLVGQLLLQYGCTVGTAESCTGGRIAAQLTSVPGSSAYFKGGIVSYDNMVKQQLLNVSPTDLQEHGAVSCPVVEQMARGALEHLHTDYAVATSGVAGPGGGTANKPVGTVWIAVASQSGVVSHKFLFGRDRAQNIIRATYNALNMLRVRILEEHGTR